MDGFPNVIGHILSSSEEDYTGLWEVVWEINSRYPDEPPDLRKATAKRAVRTLFERGWIELYECSPWPACPGPKAVPVDPESRESILSRGQNWEAPEAESPTYWIATTEEGDEADYSGSVKD